MKVKIFWKEIIAFLVLSFFIINTVNAQDKLFPELAKFELNSDYPVYTPDNLWDYINGGADSYNALGFNELHIAEYNKGKKHSIKLEIYQHANENLAFGIYALERAPSYDFFDLGVQAYREDGLIHFLKGKYYVKVTTYSDKKKVLEALTDLAFKTEELLQGSTEFPGALNMFPEEGKQEYSEMYIAENVLGHEFLNDAFRASYMVDDNRFDIYLFTGKTDNENQEMLDAYLSKYDLSPGTGPGEKFFFEDGYNGYIYLSWDEGLVTLISGLGEEDTELANKYMNQIVN